MVRAERNKGITDLITKFDRKNMITKLDKSALSKQDKECFDLAIKEAKASFNTGCYPVGAVLLLNEVETYSVGNSALSKNSSFYHAENSLIEKYGDKMYDCFKKKQSIKIYSTLEPCLMCLGTSVLNKVSEIFFIQFDPHAGACNIDIKTLGVRYSEIMPIINQIDYSKVPYDLLIKFFENEIKKQNKWGEKMLQLFQCTSS